MKESNITSKNENIKIESVPNGGLETRSHRKENKQKENPSEVVNGVFHKNSVNVMPANVCFDKNYRPKCDACLKLCDFDWYVKKQRQSKKEVVLVCVNCYETNYAKDQSNEFEAANFYNIFNQNESKIHINIRFQ